MTDDKRYHQDCRHFYWRRSGGEKRPGCRIGKLVENVSGSCKECRFFAPEW